MTMGCDSLGYDFLVNVYKKRTGTSPCYVAGKITMFNGKSLVNY